jgi:hypothetical protein
VYIGTVINNRAQQRVWVAFFLAAVALLRSLFFSIVAAFSGLRSGEDEVTRRKIIKQRC